jgi:uncharacterized Ntn-hydrolase superfamily protein
LRSVILIMLVGFLGLSGAPVAASGLPGAARPVHTYSIVARDPETGQLGVAVQSHWFAVGTLVPWAEAGVGAVATQSFVDVRYGAGGLELLRRGMPAGRALQRLLKADPTPDVRQVGMIDARGNIAQHTGRHCIPYAGHLAGADFAVQANLMTVEGVPEAMARAFQKAGGSLAERLLAALEAAQALGGDLRGKQSAAILVVRGRATDRPWEDRLVDLHVEDHAAPLQELRRLLKLHTAYHYMNLGDHSLENGDVEGALLHYGRAEALQPDNLEMKFWRAVSLVNAGRIDEAMPVFALIFSRDGDWRELVPRLAAVSLLAADAATINRIVNIEE